LNSNDNKSSKSCGIGFVGMLQIAFIVLKLTNFISWSWVMVLSPIWISVILYVVILAAVMIICHVIDKK